jgi:predicted transport protein
MLGADIEVRPTKKYTAFRRRRGFLRCHSAKVKVEGVT